MKTASQQASSTDIKRYMREVGQRGRVAARAMSRAGNAAKDSALTATAAPVQRPNGARIKAMAEGLRQIATLADPVGEITNLNYRPSGIQVGRMRVPLGVIGIIYESRPNVTADAAGMPED